MASMRVRLHGPLSRIADPSLPTSSQVTSPRLQQQIGLASGGYCSRLRPCCQLSCVRGGRQPAEPFLGALLVVLAPPRLMTAWACARAGKSVLVQALVANATVERLKCKRFCVGVPGWIRRSRTPRSCAHVSMARPQNARPLSGHSTRAEHAGWRIDRACA